MPPNSREVPQLRKSNRIRKKPERYESQHSQEGSRGVGPVAPPPEKNNNWFVDYDNHNPDSDDEQVEEGGREQGEEVEGDGEVGVDVEEEEQEQEVGEEQEEEEEEQEEEESFVVIV